MKTQRTADIGVGVFIALLGIFILIASISITGGAAHRLPPRTFPMVVGFLLLICGISLMLKSWSIKEVDVAIKWPDRKGLRTILVTLGSLAVFIVLMDPLGFLVPTTLFMLFISTLINKGRLIQNLILAIAFSVITYGVFAVALKLSLPRGFIEQLLPF